jgi:hypothetical protein
MKLLLKYLIYSLLVVCMITGSLMLFKSHPEVQFAFIIPGVFVVIYSVIHDDLYVKRSLRHRKMSSSTRVNLA